MSCRVESIFKVQINPDHSTAFLLCLLCPLDYHLCSSVCSEAILGTFHDRVVFGELSDSACGYQHEQLVYGVQEYDRSIVIQYGYAFVLVDENKFRHQQFSVAFVNTS